MTPKSIPSLLFFLVENTPRSTTLRPVFLPQSVKLRSSDRSLTSSAPGQSRIKWRWRVSVCWRALILHTPKIVQKKLKDSISWGEGRESHRAASGEHLINGGYRQYLQIHSYLSPFAIMVSCNPLNHYELNLPWSLALGQLSSITGIILEPGRWMGEEVGKEAEKNGWNSHGRQENNWLNWVLSNLTYLSQTQ